jgi:ketosteroid isomerase-like protein
MILSLMSDDVVFVPGMPPMKGRTIFEKGLQNLLKSHRIDSQDKILERRSAAVWHAVELY